MHVMVFWVFLNPSTLSFYNKDCSAPKLNNFDFFCFANLINNKCAEKYDLDEADENWK